MHPFSRVNHAMTSTALLLSLAPLLVAQNAQSENSPLPTAQQFVTAAIESGYREVVLAQLATERTTNEYVKDYANQLIVDHGEMNGRLTELARQKGLTIPDLQNEANTLRSTQQAGKSDQAGAAERLDPDSIEAKIAALRTAYGNAFDRQYLSLMIETHEKTIRLYQQYALGGQDTDLRDFADTSLDTLRDQVDEARDLSEEL